MVAGRPSPAPLGPVYPAGSALGGGWGLLWPYGTCVVRWCLDAVAKCQAESSGSGASAGTAGTAAQPAEKAPASSAADMTDMDNPEYLGQLAATFAPGG